MPRPQIQAGQLRHRLDIIAPTLVQDTFGGTDIDQENVVATIWGYVESLTGRELEAAQQIVAQVTHKITIRWMDGLRPQQNVVFDNRLFQIQAIQNPDERHHALILLCVERQDTSAGAVPVSVP